MLLALSPLVLIGCASAPKRETTTANVCPEAIVITEEEEEILSEMLPDFFLRFTNQQLDLDLIPD